MPLHPQCKDLLDSMAAMGSKPIHEMTPEEVRAIPMADLGVPVEHVAEVQDREVPGPAGPIRVRVYIPVLGKKLGGLVFFHGGGWVVGSLDSHDRECRTLANKAGCVVVAVDYRLAPEHPYPAAAEDAYAATSYIAANAAQFRIDPERIAVGGDSAGATLATVVALMARDQGGPKLIYQALIYPVTDAAAAGGSLDEFAEGYFLTRAGMEWFWSHYVPRPEDRTHHYISPYHADVHGLPPAMVVTAEFDPLRDQGEAYARKLQAAGVPVVARRYEGMFHPFFSLGAVIDQARELHDDVAAELRAALAPAG